MLCMVVVINRYSPTQTRKDLGHIYVLKGPMQVGTEYSIFKYDVIIYKQVQLKFKFQYIGIYSAAARQHGYLCYRPIVFFLRLLLIALLFCQGNIRRAFQKCYSTFLKIAYLKFHILKLRNP